MRAAEFLRTLADIVIYLDGDGSHDQADGNKVDDNVGEFTPPLQAKIELLKKANNVRSVYDNNSETMNSEQASHLTKLEAADDDGPFEG